MPTATALFVDGPCRLQKRQISFDVQPPETLACRGTTYTYSAHQGIEYLNYVVRGGQNDTGATGIRGREQVFQAWRRLHFVWNHVTREQLLRTRRASQRVRRAVR